MTIIEIMPKYKLKYPNSGVDDLVQNLRDFWGAKKFTHRTHRTIRNAGPAGGSLPFQYQRR
jgi:hypothetical protein